MSAIAKWIGIGGAVAALGLTGFAQVPGKVARFDGRQVGQYVGLGWTNDNSWLGYRYYRFVQDFGDDGHCVVEFQGLRYNPFTGYRSDGTVFVRGTVLVDGTGIDLVPLFDEIDSATCVRPDGTIGSTIEDGNGTWTTYYPDGTLRTLRTFENRLLMSSQRLNPDGTIEHEWRL